MHLKIILKSILSHYGSEKYSVERKIYRLYYNNLLEWVYVYFYTKTNTHNAVLKSHIYVKGIEHRVDPQTFHEIMNQ